ncbi:MAG TPA: hypothetical protein VEX37_06460 [Thermomicrobiales bacterium]|nr:hypothetical protein [Thermomicrobiales bacterium]
MSDTRTVVYISPDSELGQKLRDAAEAGEPIVIDTDEAQYEIKFRTRPTPASPPERDTSNAAEEVNDDKHPEGHDPLLNIFGIFSSGEPNDVARDKNRYLAEVYLSELK